MSQLSDREELLAIAAWRDLLLDRQAGRVRAVEEVAAHYRGAEAFVAAELRHAHRGLAEGALVGQFRLERLLGRGGQAEVWLARDEALAGRAVALKLFALTGGSAAATAAMRLRQEVALAARADVPGVCPIHATGADVDRAWIAMRYLEGTTLQQELAAHPGVPDKDALLQRLAWIEAVARTVHAVHQSGVVHRDLKPSNIMLERGAGPVVLDFGVAKALEHEDALTATGAPIGTPAYMAPEQIRSGEVGPAADVFALGAVLFECVVGERPFRGVTPFDLQRAIVEAPHGAALPWRRQVARDLAIVLDTALAKAPAHRYASALDLAEDLQRVRERRPVLARPAGVFTHLVRFAQRRPAIALLLALLGFTIAAALAVALWLLSARDREQERADSAQRLAFQMSGRGRLEQLRRELDDELAIDSEHLPQFLSWWARASVLLDQLPQREAFRDELRAKGVPKSEGDPVVADLRRKQQERLAVARLRQGEYRRVAAERQQRGEQPIGGIDYALRTAEELVQQAEAALAAPAGLHFEDPDLEFAYNDVAEFVTALRAFAELRPGLFTRKAEHWLWQKAQRVRADSIDTRAGEWTAAIARIAAPEGRYGGLRLQPQEGLAPLGPDPVSGLEEFAHVSTGSVPTRDPQSGRLLEAADAAIVLVLLPGGTARIGALHAPPPTLAPQTFELPPATAVPLLPFFIGKYEVTQAQWKEIMFAWPSTVRQGSPPRERLPVDTISCELAERFVRRLGLLLPTEAQWEHAARAGTDTAFWFGDDAGAAARFGRVAEADGRPVDGYLGPILVGGTPANPFGLFDVVGNVAEWTRDAASDYSAPFGAGDGLRAPSSVTSRVIRGGSYRERAAAAQSWWRTFEPPQQLRDVGLRVARPVR